MNDYLEKYPDDKDIVFALCFSFGEDEANRICARAISEGKKIEVSYEEGLMDKLDYKLV
jgi:hypothetical protein